MALSRRKAMIGTASIALFSSIGVSARTKFTKDRFIESVRQANRETDAQTAVHEVIAKAVDVPGDVVAALGTPSQAGIQTLYNDGSLTILNVIWAPLMVLFPHDHRMWATIGVYGGREDNIIWQKQGDSVQASGAASLKTGDIFSLPYDVVHSVVNPIEKLTGAIHVYGGNFFAPGRSEWDPETLERRPFNLEDALRTFREANDRFNLGERT